MKREKEDKLKYIAGFHSYKKKREEYDNWQRLYFLKYDGELDTNKSKISYLLNPIIAEMLKSAIHSRDGKEYDLIVYSIMPNHVHIMFTPRTNEANKNEDRFMGTKILKSLKWYSAREANKILGREGAFWQNESYDHVVRNEIEF